VGKGCSEMHLWQSCEIGGIISFEPGTLARSMYAGRENSPSGRAWSAKALRFCKAMCAECCRTLANESVHCVVTSPPYWGLRDYGCERMILTPVSMQEGSRVAGEQSGEQSHPNEDTSALLRWSLPTVTD
jgi:hypothetical protein